MHHFAYRDGVLHAEDIALPALAEKVETPFYCYSAATIRRHFTVFAKAFDGLDALVCYAMKANSNQAVLTLLASLGAGMDVVSGGELARALKAGREPGKNHLLRRRQDRAGDRGGAGRRYFLLQRRIRARTRGHFRHRGGERTARENFLARQPGRGRKNSRQNLHRQEGEQVRRAAVAGPRGLCPRLEAAGTGDRRRRHAHRLTAHRSRALRRGVLPAGELVRDLRADGHEISHVDLGGGLGVPFTGGKIPTPTTPSVTARWCAGTSRGSAASWCSSRDGSSSATPAFW